jgi:CxxC-x17-CxxC domain-containing protein
MAYTDRTLKCEDCGADFIYTAGEQAFYAEKGFANEPKRCKDCRGKKKADRRSSRADRTMFETTCSQCNAPTTVPFQPTQGRPVFCKPCFDKQRGTGGGGRPSNF